VAEGDPVVLGNDRGEWVRTPRRAPSEFVRFEFADGKLSLLHGHQNFSPPVYVRTTAAIIRLWVEQWLYLKTRFWRLAGGCRFLH